MGWIAGAIDLPITFIGLSHNILKRKSTFQKGSADAKTIYFQLAGQGDFWSRMEYGLAGSDSGRSTYLLNILVSHQLNNFVIEYPLLADRTIRCFADQYRHSKRVSLVKRVRHSRDSLTTG
jgi:hypothetical protein